MVKFVESDFFKVARCCYLLFSVFFLFACSEKMENPKKDDSFEVVELFEDDSSPKTEKEVKVESPENKSDSFAEENPLIQDLELDFSESKKVLSAHKNSQYYLEKNFQAPKLSLELATSGKIVWPSESKAFDEGLNFKEFIQNTYGKTAISGLFGDVRNNGYKFHEGIDIKSIRKDKKGESLDEIYAAMAGKVLLVNKVAGNSSYGRYVVILHENLDVPIYTLYAHLRSIEPTIAVSKNVRAGEKLGIMGRSATYNIAKECSHLHFEVGLAYSKHFQKWYDSKRYNSKNFFGNYNGMNLIGLDPLNFLYSAKEGKLNEGVANFILSQEIAFVVRYHTAKTPDFAKMYPALVDGTSIHNAWDISFTWWGFPVKMTKVNAPIQKSKSNIEIISFNESSLRQKCLQFIKFDSSKNAKPSSNLETIIKKLF